METENTTFCEFSDAVYWDDKDLQLYPVDDNSSKGIKGNWNFSKMTCYGTSSEMASSTFAQTIEKIENASTGSEFYVSKTINYGDILLSFFILLFVVFGVFKFLISFVIPKFINFKRS